MKIIQRVQEIWSGQERLIQWLKQQKHIYLAIKEFLLFSFSLWSVIWRCCFFFSSLFFLSLNLFLYSFKSVCLFFGLPVSDNYRAFIKQIITDNYRSASSFDFLYLIITDNYRLIRSASSFAFLCQIITDNYRLI